MESQPSRSPKPLWSHCVPSMLIWSLVLEVVRTTGNARRTRKEAEDAESYSTRSVALMFPAMQLSCIAQEPCFIVSFAFSFPSFAPGSVVDVGKIVAAIATNGGEPMDYMVSQCASSSGLQHFRQHLNSFIVSFVTLSTGSNGYSSASIAV
jgi:hypothetical protein